MSHQARVNGLARDWQGYQAGQPDVPALAVCESRHAYDGGRW